MKRKLGLIGVILALLALLVAPIAQGGNYALGVAPASAVDGGVLLATPANPYGAWTSPPWVASPVPISLIEAGAPSTVVQTNAFGAEVNAAVTPAEIAPCTAGQVLLTNATPAQACTTVSQDLLLSSSGVATVLGLQGNAVASGALTQGDALFATNTTHWAQGAFSGDLSCSFITPGLCTAVSGGLGAMQFGTGGTINWPNTSNVLLSQSSTTSLSPSTMNLLPEVSTNANGNGSQLDINLSIPSGTGTEGSLAIFRGGTGVDYIGGFPGSGSVGTLWLGLNGAAPDGTNFSVARQPSPGPNTYLNASTGGGFFFSVGGPSALTLAGANANGFQFYDGQNFDLGGGVKVIGIGGATTSPSTPPASGDAVLSSQTSGLYADLGSTSFVVQKLLPTFTGTLNTQARTIEMQGTFCRTTSETPVTCLTIPLPANTCAAVHFYAVGRLFSGITDATYSFGDVGFCAGSSTITVAGSPTITNQTITVSAGSVSVTSSGLNALVQSISTGTNTVDWTFLSPSIIYN